MPSPRASVTCGSLVLALAVPADAPAQIRASERGSVSQTVDGTVVTVDYARPQARGRDSLFGRVVHPGDMWTPGANWATTLEVSRAVRLGGQAVPAGKYSVWMTPEKETWTVYLHRNPRLFHTQKPKPEEMFLALPVTPEVGEPAEVLSFDFPRVGRDRATLRFRWGITVVSLEVEVQPSRAARKLSTQETAPYLGSYTATMALEDGGSMEMKVEVINANGSLRAVMDGSWGAFVMEFLPTDEPHRFLPALLDGEAVFDVEEVPVLFELDGARAVGFRIMGIGDDVWIRAQRKS
jgi:hypothetical protein